MVRTLTVVVVGLMVSGAVANNQPAKLDTAKLVGSYTFVSGVKDGEKVEGGNFKGVAFVVTKENLLLKTPEGDFKFGYKIDATQSPAAIDLEILDGPIGKGAKSKGIIALDGNTLKIAYHPMEGDRPKDFEAKKGSGVYSFTVKRTGDKK